MARIDPLPRDQWSPQMREALGAMVPTQRRYPLTREGRPSGTNILGALAHHPGLAKRYFALNGHLLLATTLSERHRELIIMRAAVLAGSSYEWVQHIFLARDAGLSDLEIAWIAWGPDAPFWDACDAAVLRAVDDLANRGAIGDDAWAAVTAHLDTEQVLDLIFTAGSYTLLAWMVNSLQIPLDDDLRAALTAAPRPAAPDSHIRTEP
ncbi:MAG TPA: carboxymuconolactone decarboxylase family protein [Mycobacterium sp.]|uniref:carboxymuconolactone decarboxylase family protein n=1 Tax=Mycobacterium sp. TaxID=1785 RepID=UPI002C6E33BA|nr:carboxymuconolactone decarboxylase family protein [Mycobacterium sp.]HME75799.1 carboxymuconolactone decarboxylase family protein [Mycobacterium sp.]